MLLGSFSNTSSRIARFFETIASVNFFVLARISCSGFWAKAAVDDTAKRQSSARVFIESLLGEIMLWISTEAATKSQRHEVALRLCAASCLGVFVANLHRIPQTLSNKYCPCIPSHYEFRFSTCNKLVRFATSTL